MNTESIERHLDFLRNNIYREASGQTRAYRDGKNKAIRDAAGRTLDNLCRDAQNYLDRNQDLFDFMVAYHGCAPEYLEYPEWDHIEGDTQEYIQALEHLLLNPDE